ncbi:hypothetical protein ACH4TQ_50765 [Streptomyces sp. NPDC021218]|uniref:hypothetical protein n=1 Tax=Streptomyces sp. NPDC021218 TaxID=3365119 RepID=UPI0037BCC313
MGGLLFFNGPVHNGGFTFTSRPGKATGIRLAAALNQLLGSEPVPHLWNTVTLAGDLRHREHAATAGEAVERTAFEAGLIAAKYDDGQPPASGIVTDADPQVAALALEMIEARLSTGALSVSTERIPHCPGCGHMAGTGAHPCQVCGNETLLARPRRVLVAERALGRPALDVSDVHAHHRRAPVHLRNIAGNVPARLILSRTRDHGISLGPVGLPEMVLDPRAGLHIAVLAAARARGAETAVMVLTQNAAAMSPPTGSPSSATTAAGCCTASTDTSPTTASRTSPPTASATASPQQSAPPSRPGSCRCTPGTPRTTSTPASSQRSSPTSTAPGSPRRKGPTPLPGATSNRQSRPAAPPGSHAAPAWPQPWASSREQHREALPPASSGP